MRDISEDLAEDVEIILRRAKEAVLNAMATVGGWSLESNYFVELR